MMRIIRNIAIVAGGAALLASCGGSSSPVASTTPTPGTTVTTASFQSRFGTPFQTAFDASTTATANHPAATDVPALNLTAEPLDN